MNETGKTNRIGSVLSAIFEMSEATKSICIQILVVLLITGHLIFDVYTVVTGQVNMNHHWPFFTPVVLISLLVFIRRMEKVLAKNDAELAKNHAWIFND